MQNASPIVVCPPGGHAERRDVVSPDEGIAPHDAAILDREDVDDHRVVLSAAGQCASVESCSGVRDPAFECQLTAQLAEGRVPLVPVRYHVSSALNRDSIRVHGLDWRYMKAAPGVAGSRRPEQEGCFLGEAHDVDWFIRMNNTGGPVDVWEVSDVVIEELLNSSSGYWYLPKVIGPDRLRLVQQDIPPETVE